MRLYVSEDEYKARELLIKSHLYIGKANEYFRNEHGMDLKSIYLSPKNLRNDHNKQL